MFTTFELCCLVVALLILKPVGSQKYSGIQVFRYSVKRKRMEYIKKISIIIIIYNIIIGLKLMVYPP